MCQVSIIVPVYNAGLYISEMYNSLKNQVYKEFEVIFVDDGSTDNSLQILKNIAECNKNISYYALQHSGVSRIRNFGISKAKGQYIVFIDADDLLEPLYLKNLVSYMNNEVDMVVCGYQYETSTGDVIRTKVDNQLINLSQSQAIEMCTQRLNGFEGYVWNKIFKKSIIAAGNIKFDEVSCIYEDFLFCVEYLKLCRKVIYNNVLGYHYILRNNSSMVVKNLNKLENGVYTYGKIVSAVSSINKNVSKITMEAWFSVLLSWIYEISKQNNYNHKQYDEYNAFMLRWKLSDCIAIGKDCFLVRILGIDGMVKFCKIRKRIKSILKK